jgi:hypothetical protein
MFLKDGGARLDYEIDWTAVCGPDRGIEASDWSVVPAREGGVRILGQAIEGNRTIAWVEGGREGDVVGLVNRVAFTDGTADERSVTLRVGER